AAGVRSEATTFSDTVALQMTTMTQLHEQIVLEIKNEIAEETCYNEAGMELVGVRTAALKIQTATLNLSEKLAELNNTKNTLSRLLIEGHQALDYETARTVSPLTIDFWFDEGIVRYADYLRQAQRAVYLAVLAVEYEMQISSAEREVVLAARSPAE